MKKRNIFFSVLSIVLFLVTIGGKNVYCQTRQVNYCTITRTLCAIPTCIDEKEITDLDRVRMMHDELLECTEDIIRGRELIVTTYYPQRPRYENDYQYMRGKSVVSREGTFFYDHEGKEIAFVRNEGVGENFILPYESIREYGVYNQTFEVDRERAIRSLRESRFEVYEDRGFIVAVSRTVEIAVNLREFIFETRFFDEKDRRLQLLHRINYRKTERGYIVPVSETEMTYDTLPSKIPYQITRVKSYLSYQVIQDGNYIINEGERVPYDRYLDFLHKSADKEGDIGQFEEIQQRETEIKLYPNPANEYITVVLPFYMDEDVDITLFNTMGIAVMSQHYVQGGQIDIDIHSLPAGIYTVRCVKDHKVISTRFVKQ
jgi:hypothetical protein